MKVIKALVAIALTEIIIAIPIVTGIYAWGMLAFTPNDSTKANENIHEAVGKFHGTIETTDDNGNADTYYQFKSNNNEVWWMLTETEIGFIPSENTEYKLTYDNNGTTRENKTCDCLPEWDCECEVYDDTFISIETIQN